MYSSTFQQIYAFAFAHWQMVTVCFLILLIIIWCEWVSGSNKPPSLTPSSMVSAMNSGSIPVDIRSEEQFKAGHILNSVRLDPADIGSKKWGKYKAKSIIIVCQRGVQALEVGAKLIKKDFNEVFILSGGITAWETQNMPLSKGKE